MLIKYPRFEINKLWIINPHLKQVEEFKALTYKQMCFVALYSDPFSPALYARHRDEMDDREFRKYILTKVKYFDGGTNLRRGAERIIDKKIPKIEEAIKVYKHAWPERDTYLLYKNIYLGLQQFTELPVGHKNYSVSKAIEIMDKDLITKAKDKLLTCLDSYRELSAWFEEEAETIAEKTAGRPLFKKQSVQDQKEEVQQVEEEDWDDEEMWDPND